MTPIKKVLSAQDSLLGVCRSRLGQTLTGEAFADYVRDMRLVIPSADLRALGDSLRNIAGREMTEATAAEVAWRLAGNMAKLKAGRTVSPWTMQIAVEWVTIQVFCVARRSRQYRAKTGEQAMRTGQDGLIHTSGVEVSFIVLDGSPAGRRFTVFWSSDRGESVKHHFGFDKRNKQRFSRNVSTRPSWPFLDAREFYRLRLQVMLDPAMAPAGEVGFLLVRGRSSTKSWNRDIMRCRLRDNYKCPGGFPADFACHDCPIGVGRCVAACHAHDYVVGHCDTCHRPGQRFDVDIDTKICLDCARSAR